MSGAHHPTRTTARHAPTDEEILGVLRPRPGGVATYVVANVLIRESGIRTNTAAVRTRLKRMERQGRVEEISPRTGHRGIMLWWRIKEEPAAKVAS